MALTRLAVEEVSHFRRRVQDLLPRRRQRSLWWRRRGGERAARLLGRGLFAGLQEDHEVGELVGLRKESLRCKHRIVLLGGCRIVALRDQHRVSSTGEDAGRATCRALVIPPHQSRWHGLRCAPAARHAAHRVYRWRLVRGRCEAAQCHKLSTGRHGAPQEEWSGRGCFVLPHQAEAQRVRQQLLHNGLEVLRVAERGCARVGNLEHADRLPRRVVAVHRVVANGDARPCVPLPVHETARAATAFHVRRPEAKTLAG